MKKMLILATGEVEEFDDGYAQRLCEFGKAEYVKEEKPVKAEVVVTDKIPEIEKPAEEAPKSAKPKKK